MKPEGIQVNGRTEINRGEKNRKRKETQNERREEREQQTLLKTVGIKQEEDREGGEEGENDNKERNSL